MKLNWTGERAIGFVVGVAASLMFAATLATGSPLPGLGGLLTIAVGVLAPRVTNDRL